MGIGPFCKHLGSRFRGAMQEKLRRPVKVILLTRLEASRLFILAHRSQWIVELFIKIG